MSIEKFIQDNRGDFDDKTPSGKVWENVEAAVEGREKKRVALTPLFKWSIAATILLLISAGVYFLSGKTRPNESLAGTVDTSKILNTSVPDAPEVNQFAQMIALKQEELKTLGKEQPELYRKFTNDITQLDSSYKALKNQLSVTPNREMLIEAMIQNLQLQLNVLNQQLNIINQIKQSKEYDHEKINKSI